MPDKTGRSVKLNTGKVSGVTLIGRKVHGIALTRKNLTKNFATPG